MTSDEDAAAATPRRVASLRVNRAMTGARWVSIGRARALSAGSGRGAAGRPGRALLATRPLTTLPSARPRVRGESQPMTLPMSRGVVAPVAAMASSTRAVDLGLGQRCGQVLGEDVDLGLLLGGEVLAAAPWCTPRPTRGAS